MKKDNNDFRMPFGLENQNERGSIKLHEGVISSVVKNAALSVDGVIKLAGVSTLTDSIAYMIGHKKSSEGAIEIEILDDESVIVKLKVVVVYGENIPSVALNIQMTIIEKVKAITGMDVKSVDVIIQGIEELPEPEEEEDDNSEE
ncbi:MAG: Asp23/Gls24 family envelope stress response protein [bacterium]|nr:Asp23/Gls24 family envelope stress response protein [bacterium]